MPKTASTRATAPRRKTPAATAPSAAQIAQRAHQIFEARGASHGGELDDWLQAERELRKATGQTTVRRKKKVE